MHHEWKIQALLQVKIPDMNNQSRQRQQLPLAVTPQCFPK